MAIKNTTLSQLICSFAAIAVFAALGLVLTRPVFSALPLFTVRQANHWDFAAFPVTFSVNPSTGSNVSGGSAAARAVINTSFQTWNTAPNAVVQVTVGSDSSLNRSGFDGTNLICFVCDADFTEDSTTLAVTLTTSSDRVGEDTRHGQTSRFVGQLIDADIIFNPAVQWSTTGTATEGFEDLQTVATHEIGHFLGLDHSAVIRAIMYPFAPPGLVSLSYDDVAGLSQLYPKGTPDFPTGSISGTIRFSSGGGVFGAHVFADSNDGGGSISPIIRKSTVSAMSGTDGSYAIRGLPPGTYTVGAEPLDEPVTNDDLDFASAFGQSSVQTNFKTTWH